MVKNPEFGKKYWTISVSRGEMFKEVPQLSEQPWRYPDKEKAAIQKKRKPRQIILIEFSSSPEIRCDKKNKRLVKIPLTYDGRLVSQGKYHVCQFGGLTKAELFSTKKAANHAYYKYLLNQERKHLKLAYRYRTLVYDALSAYE